MTCKPRLKAVSLAVFGLSVLLASPWIRAANGFAEPLPPPPMPQQDAVDTPPNTELEPQVVIKRRGKDVIQEYRVNGHLYMVKITPSKGRPYYLIDTDGDGNLETYRNELADPIVPQWPLLRW